MTGWQMMFEGLIPHTAIHLSFVFIVLFLFSPYLLPTSNSSPNPYPLPLLSFFSASFTSKHSSTLLFLLPPILPTSHSKPLLFIIYLALIFFSIFPLTLLLFLTPTYLPHYLPSYLASYRACLPLPSLTSNAMTCPSMYPTIRYPCVHLPSSIKFVIDCK